MLAGSREGKSPPGQHALHMTSEPLLYHTGVLLLLMPLRSLSTQSPGSGNHHCAQETINLTFFQLYVCGCFACVSVLLVYLCATHMSFVCGGHHIPWNWITEGCELPHGCWKLNPSPLQE